MYPLSGLFILFLTLPSSASSYYSYGDTLLDNANVFGVLPASPARSFAVRSAVNNVHGACMPVIPSQPCIRRVMSALVASDALCRPCVKPAWAAVCFQFQNSLMGSSM